MAAKVQTKLEKLTARVGIFCAESFFRGFQLDKLINEVLGVRSKAHNGFQWDEVIRLWHARRGTIQRVMPTILPEY